MTPSHWEFFLLALAAVRIWKLIRDDVVLDSFRNGFLDRLTDKRAEAVVEFLWCPWCSGFWIALGLYTGWVIFGGWWMFIVVVFALSFVVGALGAVLKHL